MDTKNIKDFPEILQINDNTRLLGIGNNNIGDGAKITIDRLMSQSISPSEDNLLSLDDNNKLFVPKSGEIVFNNPFAFGDFKYSDHVISNLSWVLSDGQRKSGTFYEQYYNWLLSIYNGTITISGISVKSIDDSSATDYDYKIDTDSREFILPTETILHPIDSSNNIPVVGNGISLGLTDGTHNYALQNSNAGSIGANIISGNYGYPVGTAYNTPSGTVANTTLGLTTDGTKSGIEANLSSAKATAYLYYFVGDVIQGANVIDVVRLEEQITEVSNIVSDRIYIKDTYVNRTSGYRIWSDGYCEQWGRGTVGSSSLTIKLAKTYKDINYDIQVTTDTDRGAGGIGTSAGVMRNQATTNSFKISQYGSYTFPYWRTCGYLAEGEY